MNLVKITLGLLLIGQLGVTAEGLKDYQGNYNCKKVDQQSEFRLKIAIAEDTSGTLFTYGVSSSPAVGFDEIKLAEPAYVVFGENACQAENPYIRGRRLICRTVSAEQVKTGLPLEIHDRHRISTRGSSIKFQLDQSGTTLSGIDIPGSSSSVRFKFECQKQ